MPLDSSTFSTLRQQGDRIGEKRDCAVIAVAALSMLQYDTVHTLFHHFGRRPRCGTQFSITKKVLDHLSYSVHDISRFYINHSTGDGFSVRSLSPMLPSIGTFLIRTRGHIVAVVDGVVHDWSAMRKLYVQHVYQVNHNPAKTVTTLQHDAISGQMVPVTQTIAPDPFEYEPFAVPLKPTNQLPKGSVDTFKPTWAVHDIAYRLYQKIAAATPPPTNSAIEHRRWVSTFRAQVVAECITHGIHKTTAAVQVGKWIKGLHPSSR